MRVAVAVSGGVDSLCAMLLLHQAGYEVVALHGLFLSDANKTDYLNRLQDACNRLKVPLQLVNLQATFRKKIILPFVKARLSGLTPNPCAVCNREIKFGALLQQAFDLGCEYLATGHYAQLLSTQFGKIVTCAQDPIKDQSYFLSIVPQSCLQHLLFPLATLKKTETKNLIIQAHLPLPLPQESQDICFVPNRRAACLEYIRSQSLALGLRLPQGGSVLLLDKNGQLSKIGQHNGLWLFTEGQRRGLGIAYSEGLYVLSRDLERNALIVGTHEMLGITGCLTEPANLFYSPELWPTTLLVRLRYRQQAVPAMVSLTIDNCLHIDLKYKQHPTSPGQIAAVYDLNGHLLAGGIVRSMW